MEYGVTSPHGLWREISYLLIVSNESLEFYDNEIKQGFDYGDNLYYFKIETQIITLYQSAITILNDGGISAFRESLDDKTNESETLEPAIIEAKKRYLSHCKRLLRELDRYKPTDFE